MGRTEAFIRFRDDVTKVEKLKPRESASAPTSTRFAGLGLLFDGLCGWVKSIPNIGHPNLATYPEDWKESARIVALQKQDHWEDFTRERIQRSVDRIANQSWISDPHPHINQSTSKRLSLFTRAEQKEINRAKTMKQLPDLSLIVAEKIGAKRGASGSKVGPSGLEVAETTPIAAEQARTGGSSQGKSSKKSKKNAGGGKKRKAGDLPTEDAPKKKRMKKKELALPRSSSVCEEELQALVPETIPEVGTSEDDENETIALRRRRRESRVTEEVSRGALAGDLRSTEVPREIQTSGGQRDRLRNESPAHVTEGSETRVSEAKMAAELLRHSEEMDRLRKSRKYEVTHERIRVLIAMIAKAEKRFHKISLREDKRDKYDDARCLYSQAFGTRKCLEQIKASGVEIPQETIDFFIGQEKHYEEEAERLEVKEIPAEDLCLSPLVLESRFLIEEIWRQLDPFGSNINLIDSEAAIALRTPLLSEDPMEEPAQTAVSSNQPTDQDIDPAKQASAGAVVLKDGAVPTIVLTDSPAKASKNASSSASSSEDPEKGDDAPAGMPTADVTAPAPTKFGRVSGPGEGDDGGNKDPPVVD
ncbi:BnaA05g16400D [Brassica napus]|uniref:BnaA05g16400D protein n=1 Tax=Brassica napus TaxID=3708 RepID=A0A078HCV8_BRANA|nr:BnaA05g16400D [Brassica napus]